MNIIVSANSKYMRYLYVMLLSLFENNDDESITVYVMQKDFSETDKKTIELLASGYRNTVVFLDIEESVFSGFPVSAKFSVETYFRLLMPELLPDSIDKILYLDVDVIIRGKIKPFYCTDLEDKIAAVCRDADHPVLEDNKIILFKREKDFRYFNAGVALYNVPLLKERYSFKIFKKAAEELGFQLQFADQEILNYLLYDKVIYSDYKMYNYLVRGEADISDLRDDEAVIMHFAGCNPWQKGQKNSLYHIWWDYAKKSPFYLELLEENLYAELDFSSEIDALKLREFEMMEIYEHAFYLKGTGRIKRSLAGKHTKLGIYGAGVMAEVLYELLLQDEIWSAVKSVVDMNKKGEFHGITISQELTKESGMIWLVTPVYKPQRLAEELSLRCGEMCRVISLREWLKNIS